MVLLAFTSRENGTTSSRPNPKTSNLKYLTWLENALTKKKSRDSATKIKVFVRAAKLAKLKPNLFSIEEMRKSRTTFMICANPLRDMRLSWLVLSWGTSRMQAKPFDLDSAQKKNCTRTSSIWNCVISGKSSWPVLPTTDYHS